MAKVLNKTFSWTVSNSPDVVGHNVYVKTGTVAPTYTDLKQYYALPVASVNLPDGFTGFPLFDGDYMIGVSAVDDWGNESDIVSIKSPFDFIAPNAPTNLKVT